MNIVSKGRGQGKTYDLIITSSVTGYPIIVPNKMMAEYVKNQAIQMNRTIPEPMSFQTYLLTQNGRSNKNILIDELDMVLNQLLQCNVVSATHTLKDGEKND